MTVCDDPEKLAGDAPTPSKWQAAAPPPGLRRGAAAVCAGLLAMLLAALAGVVVWVVLLSSGVGGPAGGSHVGAAGTPAGAASAITVGGSDPGPLGADGAAAPVARELDGPAAGAGAAAGRAARRGSAAAGGTAAGPAAKAQDSLLSTCPTYYDTSMHRKSNHTDFLNTTVAVSPRRPTADRAAGEWIPGRATFYGTDERVEAQRVACGEPAGQFGIIEHGSCGYTNSDGSLPFPRDVYIAAADTNEDYPGSCGRCYQIRCRSGFPENNGRPIQISDLLYYKPYNVTDNKGRLWPGNPYLEDDMFYVKCWDDDQTITVRVGDSCQCHYPIKDTGELRVQNWCCGGNNHFDLSFWAFEKLAHPSYGVMKLEYRPVDCDTNEPLKPVPGFVSQKIYKDTIQPGWLWRPYACKDTRLVVAGEGVGGGAAMCATASKEGAVAFVCRNCTQEGYRPFARASSLDFWVKSNTRSADPYASSTPPGKLPPLKVFLMNDEESLYCGSEVVLSQKHAVGRRGDWYRVSIPLSDWRCDKGSAGSLASINRVDIQNVEIRDANFCLDGVQLAGSAEPPAEAADGAGAAGGEAAPPAEVPPAEVPPAEAQPAEAQPAEAQPAEGQPAEAPPAEAQPAEAQPAQAADAEPADVEAADGAAAEAEPTQADGGGAADGAAAEALQPQQLTGP